MTSLFRNTGKPLRIAVYHRIGQASAQAVVSNELLKKQFCREMNQNENMIITDYYFDDSPVGSDSPERERLLADCRAGKIDAIMARSIKRFCDDHRILLEVIKELSSLTPPVDVYFMFEQVHSTGPESDLLQTYLKERTTAWDTVGELSPETDWGEPCGKEVW